MTVAMDLGRFDLSLVPWHEGEALAAMAMPLGGIGTGTVAIAGDGSLRQWQLNGTGNHDAFLPDSFLVLRCSRPGDADAIRALEAYPVTSGPVPNVTDGDIPDDLRRRHAVFEPFARSRIRAAYPVAEVELADDDVPIRVTLQAFNPFVPLDEETSSLPVAMLEVTLHNPTAETIVGSVTASLQNATGWDGIAPIDGTRCASYGGAFNRVRRRGATSSVVMSNATLPSGDAGYGQLTLSTDGPGTHVLEQYGVLGELAAFVRSHYFLDRDLDSPAPPATTAGRGHHGGVRPAVGPSPAGSTWNGAITVPFRLASAESRRVRFWMTWWFPNRYVDFLQFGEAAAGGGDDASSSLFLGAHYATLHPDAVAVADLVADGWDALADATGRWLDAFRGVADPVAVEHLLAQASMVRTAATFRSADGRFLGFEGVQGALLR